MWASLVAKRSRQAQLLRLIPYLKRYRRRVIIGASMVLLTNVAAVVLPWILRYAIDDLQIQVSRQKLAFYALLLLAASLIEGVFRFLMRRILIGVSRHIEYDLRNDLFAHLQKLSPSFFQKNPTGDLMARATNDLNAVRSVLGPGIMYSLNTFFTMVFTISLLLGLEPQLAVLTLLPLLLVSVSVKYFGKRIHERFRLIQEQFSRLTTMVQENVSGVRVVKAYGQEEALNDRFRKANELYMARSLELVKVQGIYNPLLVFLLGLSSVGLLWYGGRQVIVGAISLGDFVAFMSYLAMLTWPTIALGWVINVMERGAASMGRINRILATPPQIFDSDPRPVSRLRGEIDIRGLSFSYNGRPVLQDIDLHIRPGETVAVVGNTGSGKSTLVNLLLRLYVAPPNTIFIDGIEISEVPLKVLRRSIGYVPQDTFLFSESIALNIAFGATEASASEITRVSRVSHILTDIQGFPAGFETQVGERGITLSGGQKQRIAISRALLTRPRVLILDDALSSVDTYTEERILEKLASELSDRTAILISHRISTVKMADQIVVLDEGRIAEQGTHRDLLAADGPYARLYQKQLLREQLGIE